MKYTVRKSKVWVVGTLWMGGTASMDYDVTGYDLACMNDCDCDVAPCECEHVTRESFELWLDLYTGDFQSILGYSASLEIGEETVDFPWQSEEIECAYLDTLPEYE